MNITIDILDRLHALIVQAIAAINSLTAALEKVTDTTVETLRLDQDVAVPEVDLAAESKSDVWVWSIPRLGALHDRFPSEGKSLQLLHTINHLPGREFITLAAMAEKAVSLGLSVPPPNVEKRPEPKRSKSKWSGERNALALRMNSQKCPTDEILVAVNKLDGDPITGTHAIWNQLHKLKASIAAQPAVAPPNPAVGAVISDEARTPVELHNAKLSEMWLAGYDAKDIAAELNKMGKPFITASEVTRKAAAWGSNRPPAVPAPDPTPICFVKGGAASIEQIKQWFDSNGGRSEMVPTEMRLVTAANQLRERLKLPKFELAS